MRIISTVRVPHHEGRLPRHINVRPGPIGRWAARTNNTQERLRVMETTEAQARMFVHALLVCFYVAAGMFIGGWGWAVMAAFIINSTYRAKVYNDAVEEAKASVRS